MKTRAIVREEREERARLRDFHGFGGMPVPPEMPCVEMPRSENVMDFFENRDMVVRVRSRSGLRAGNGIFSEVRHMTEDDRAVNRMVARELSVRMQSLLMDALLDKLTDGLPFPVRLLCRFYGIQKTSPRRSRREVVRGVFLSRRTRKC